MRAGSSSAGPHGRWGGTGDAPGEGTAQGGRQPARSGPTGEGETGGRPHWRPASPVGWHVGSDRRMHREGWAQAEPGISSIDCSPFFCASTSGSCPVVNEDENHTDARHAEVAILEGLQSIRAGPAWKHSSQKRADQLKQQSPLLHQWKEPRRSFCIRKGRVSNPLRVRKSVRSPRTPSPRQIA